MGSGSSTNNNKGKRSSDANQNPTQSDKHEVSTQTTFESTEMETTEGTKYATMANEANVCDEKTHQSRRTSETPGHASLQDSTNAEDRRNASGENHSKGQSSSKTVTTEFQVQYPRSPRHNGDEGKEDIGFSAKDATDTHISATHSTSRHDDRAGLVNRPAHECLEQQGDNGKKKSQKSVKKKKHGDVSYTTNTDENHVTNTDKNHVTNLANDREKSHEYERKVESLEAEVIKLRKEKDAWLNRQAPEGLEQQNENGEKKPQKTNEEKRCHDISYNTNTDENYATDLAIDRKRLQEYERKVESLEADVMKLRKEKDTLQNSNARCSGDCPFLSFRLTLEGLEEQNEDGKQKPQKTKEEKRHDEISNATNTDENQAKDLTNDTKKSFEYGRKVESLEADVKKLRKEKDTLLNRLSEIGAIKLTENNPKVTDLSDENRPENVVLQLCEIYDNEWTDAYETLTKRQCQQIDLSVKQLLDVLKETYTICLSLTEEKRIALREAITNYLGLSKDATDLDLRETEKRIREHRKKMLERNITMIGKEVRDRLKSKLEKEIYECLSDYIGKCVIICWNMCTKEPPMYLDFGDWKQTAQAGDEKPVNMPFDKLKFVTYTKSGAYIDYVVWPAIYLYKDGPLMRKGVAQGFK